MGEVIVTLYENGTVVDSTSIPYGYYIHQLYLPLEQRNYYKILTGEIDHPATMA